MTLVPLPTDAPARTVPELVARLGDLGSRPVLTATTAAGGERTLSGAKWPRLVARAAAWLAAAGVDCGDRVALHLDNESGLEALTLHMAALWLGAVAVPVGTRLSQREVDEQVDHCGAAVVVGAGAHVPAGALDASPGIEALVDGYVPAPAAPVVESDLADILYTSGTSGRPKGVELTHGNCVACGMELCAAVSLTDTDVLQSAIPYYTSTGAHTNPLMALVARAHYVMEPRFDQHAAVDRLARAGTTTLFGVPSMLTLIVRDVDLGGLPDSLHTIVFGGSATTAAGLRRLVDAFPGRALVNLYGQTEGGPGGTVLGPDDTLAKAGSVGRRGNGPNTHFRVLRADGDDAAVDEVGEIVLRSPAVMRGYHREPEASAFALRDGWLHTTDLGRIDDDGYLWFVDRRADLVVRGGFNISTSEIEAVLLTHDGVADAAVVGVPHDVLDEDVAAYVVGDVDPDELRTFLRTRLADYKVPRRIELVDELPRGPMGKVLKRELRGDAAATIANSTEGD